MRILFLTLSRIIDISKRGIYTDLLREFVRQGHEVYVVTPFERATGRKTELFQSSGATILGVRTLNIQKTNVVEKGIGTVLLEYQYMRAIKQHLKDVQFDMVLYSTPPITFNKVISWAKRKYGAKKYLMLKDIFPQNAVDLGMFSKNSPIYWFFRSKERKLYALSDHIGCMSPANARYVIDHNPEVDPVKVEICPNSIELQENYTENSLDFSQSIRSKYGIHAEKILCIYGGNLGKPQGIDFLIECVASNEKRSNSFFLIVGSGTEFGKIKMWFDNNKPHNAILLNALPKDDYDQLMRAAQIGLIFLDRRFTIPNYPSRLLSYLENRIPIMMATDTNTDIGRIAEENGYGLWVESGDLAGFDDKLNIILGDNKLRSQMGQRGYKYLRDNYTIEQTIEIIMSHFL